MFPRGFFRAASIGGSVGKLRFVLGKGGVGRTSVAAALALSAAQRGKSVALVTLGPVAPQGFLEREWGTTPATFEARALSLESAFDIAVGRFTGAAWIPRLLARHPAYGALREVAPGVKEVAALDLLVRLSRERDLVVVDAPATGHGRSFLSAPSTAARLVTGALRDRAASLEATLRDPSTRATVVSLPEEMAAREAVELSETLDRRGIAQTRPVLNRCVPAVSRSTADRERLRALRGGGPPASAWASAALFVDDLHHLGEAAAAPIRHAVRVPWLPKTPDRLRRIADALEALS